MNIEQAVLENLRVLPSADQQEVLTFIKTLQQKPKSEVSGPQSLRSQIAQKLLPDLQRIQWLHDGYPSAVYADSLLRTMQEMFEQAPDDRLTEVLMVLHDAMAFQNRWIDYLPEQYKGAYTLLESLVDRQSLNQVDVSQAIQELNRLGFNTLPYEGMVSTEPNLDDDA
jgi:hypothetical protein